MRARALEHYLRDKDMQRPMLATQRRSEARIGQLLPPQQGKALRGHDREVAHDDRIDFRILARVFNGDCELAPGGVAQVTASATPIGSSVSPRMSALPAHVPVLPSDTYTLEKLTQLSDQRFGELLEDGRIHPGMKRNAASCPT